MASEAREKCAVAGIVSAEGEPIAAELLYESLFAMQHRGAEASGMTTLPADGRLESHRELGMVRDVYDAQTIRQLGGISGIGHNRYSTSGSRLDHPQPFNNDDIGFAFAHNGNLPDTTNLENFLGKHGVRTQYQNDSEMMGTAIAHYIRDGHDLPAAVELAYPQFKGAFSCVAAQEGTLVAFRDPKGIRPLAIGSFEDGHAVTSETCGLDIIDANYEREVAPGEMVVITEDGIYHKQIAEGEEKLDMFEFVYFARHDSYLYGKSVNEVRRNLGYQLAEQHPPAIKDTDNILVVPVPDTSIPAAEGYAEKLGLTQKQAIIKNRYIGRTFMMPSNPVRHKNLRRKHNIIPEVMKGRDVIVIDDSIVRFNTLPRLAKLISSAGARSVSALITCPPVRFPDYYGIDTPKQSELAAANMTVEQMREKIGCKYLGFLSLNRMIEATGLSAEKFNLSCFTGEYPIGIGDRTDEITTPVSMEYVD